MVVQRACQSDTESVDCANLKRAAGRGLPKTITYPTVAGYRVRPDTIRKTRKP